MKPFPHEPLSPEERELAQLTARLGPQGEPSPALDARVLAGARAALDRKPTMRRKPRWPVAMGLAASVVFAVGIAWQLRPLQPLQTVTTADAPAAAVASSDPTDRRVDLSSKSVDGAGAAMAEPAIEAMADEAMAKASAPSVTPSQANAPAYAAPPPPPPEVAAMTQAREVRSQAERRARSARVVEAPAVGQARTADLYTPPAPPAPVSMAAPAPVEEPSLSFASEPRNEAAADSISTAGILRGTPARPVPRAFREASAAKSSVANAQERESASLEHVEVTGSRLKRTDLQVPVSDDAHLPVGEWLERVRTRYGLGDAGAAKQSLLLFVKDHPGEAVPGDLEPLLEK